MDLPLALCAALCVIAALYTAVGHGGASGYIAMMALFAVDAPLMRPIALALNLAAAGYASYVYIKAGRFQPKLWLMLTIGAMPFAFFGASLPLGISWIRTISGLCLILSALLLARQIWVRAPNDNTPAPTPPGPVLSIGTGAGLGFLAGVTGTGGGIFLSPVMIFAKWGLPQHIVGTTALFIFCNSAAGLAGALPKLGLAWPYLGPPMLAVAIGAIVGTKVSVSHMGANAIRLGLILVLLMAAYKLLAI